MTRKSGGSVNGTASTEWAGRTRRTFCWNVVHWDPRYDNLLTHLDMDDDRMQRDE